MAKSADSAVRELLILDLMDAFRASLTDGQLKAYLKAVRGLDTEAVAAAVDRFTRGEVPWFAEKFPPTAPDFAREVGLHHRIRHRGESNLLTMRPEHGHISVNHGSGSINLVGLTRAEVEKVDEWKGRTPDGRNMAGMTIEQIKDAIAQPTLPMSAPRAKLQRMGS